jgi:hypothetical protein
MQYGKKTPQSAILSGSLSNPYQRIARNQTSRLPELPSSLNDSWQLNNKTNAKRSHQEKANSKTREEDMA